MICVVDIICGFFVWCNELYFIKENRYLFDKLELFVLEKVLRFDLFWVKFNIIIRGCFWVVWSLIGLIVKEK